MLDWENVRHFPGKAAVDAALGRQTASAHFLPITANECPLLKILRDRSGSISADNCQAQTGALVAI
jgi:hypothetical protein